MSDARDLGFATPRGYDIELEVIRSVAEARILDAPCASGQFAQQLTREGVFFVAMDQVAHL